MQRLHVFVDESGDEHLHVGRGASARYVLSAVCVQDKDLECFLEAANSVRRFYFQRGEMKSSKVGDNHKRRKCVLEKLAALNFWAFSFVVNKQLVRADSGLRFAPSFLKFVARKLCGHLPLVDEVRVNFDEKGREKFKREFESYLQNHFSRADLFRVISFHHLNSKENVSIQVADLMAGSVGKWYLHRSAARECGIEELLRKKTSVLEWPTLRAEGLLPESEPERFDEVVHRESFARVHAYLEANAACDDQEVSLRCTFLDWLLSHASIGDGGFLLADKILHKSNFEMGADLNPQALRSRVVGPLRDQGLLIASSPNGGYKIPDCLDDLMKYVDLCASQIPPAVSRLKRAREVLLLATGGELDLLRGDHLSRLRQIAETG